MKKILLAAALLAFAAQPVLAKGTRKVRCSCAGSHAAATNTDHRYDGAYSSRWASTAKRPGAPVNTSAMVQGTVRKGSYAGYTMASPLVSEQPGCQRRPGSHLPTPHR